MSRSRRPFRPIGRLAVVVAAACLTAGLTACEAGNNAATLEYHPANDGANTIAHGIEINDGFVLGAPAGSTLAAGQNAAVFVALFNTGPADRLVSADAPGTAASVRLPPGGIALPSQQGVYLTGPVPRIVLASLTHPLPGGGAVSVILHFMNAGSVRTTLPVIPRSTSYATFSPAPTPSPAPSASSAARGKGPGGTPAASPSPSASTP